MRRKTNFPAWHLPPPLLRLAFSFVDAHSCVAASCVSRAWSQGISSNADCFQREFARLYCAENAQSPSLKGHSTSRPRANFLASYCMVLSALLSVLASHCDKAGLTWKERLQKRREIDLPFCFGSPQISEAACGAALELRRPQFSAAAQQFFYQLQHYEAEKDGPRMQSLASALPLAVHNRMQLRR
jgi:hypothetical protein